jgi:LPS-assembly lipoprotein
MSWFRAPVALIVVLTAVLAVAACGFRPLYGTRGGTTTPDQFAQIRIEPISDRAGQQLHNHLLTAFNPDGRPATPRYTMRTTVSEGATSLAVRKSAFATRANLRVRAIYRLNDVATGANLFDGESSITVSYNILDSEFGTLMAEKDARARALRELAEDMRIRLGIFFSNQAAEGK